MSKTISDMPTAYDAGAIEPGWYARWELAGLFTADARSPKPKYSICLPPPNITGELHMGHALNHTLQDICSRYRRMAGYEVLFLPGTDHAAIATQNVIEKQLAAEGKTKEQLGREAFQARVSEWYAEVGETIVSQDRILGASLDWSRLRFTMDDPYVRSVMTAFVAFYDRGWIYRAPRIVNWCPHDQSAISDLEVKWQEHHDTLYYIRYPIEGGGDVVIATVRPETMLADTGVAVNPTDPRYQSIIGMHPDGRMNVPGLAYDGLPALEARERVVQDLKAQGFLVKEEPYTHEVGHCDRCDTVIQPLISEQWWLRMDKMRDKALAASAEGKVRWHPERYERTYLDWLHGLRDWNIGRQLWLGHRVPVYYCANGHRTVSVERPTECVECANTEITQDTDVLDTWFSSALWPFATLGWPDQTEDLRSFYPNDMNSTAREIINLWVSRMIMTGLEFMGEVPFSDVAIHCQVQAADGRRMSKSLGTGIDPRGLVEKYGADALRAWAASVAMSSQDVRYDESRIEGYRRFCNKLWNATRLVLGSIGEKAVPPVPAPDDVELIEDRWILSRLAAASTDITRGIEEFTFQNSIGAAYTFAWNEYCDWWLEAAKDRLRAGDPAALGIAVFCLDNLFPLLHPFMPFVTEELWSRMPGHGDVLMRTRWPADLTRYGDGQAEFEFESLMQAVEEIRSYRKTVPGAPMKGGAVKLSEPAGPDWVRVLAVLAKVAVVDELPPGKANGLTEGSIVFPTAAAADPAVIAKKKAELQRELDRVEARLDNPEFRAKAPESVIAEMEARAEELRAAIDRLE